MKILYYVNVCFQEGSVFKSFRYSIGACRKKTFPKNLKNGADKRREIRFYQQVIMQNKIESFALSNLSVPQNLQNYFCIFQFNWSLRNKYFLWRVGTWEVTKICDASEFLSFGMSPGFPKIQFDLLLGRKYSSTQ